MFTKLSEDINISANIKLATKWERALTKLRLGKGLVEPNYQLHIESMD